MIKVKKSGKTLFTLLILLIFVLSGSSHVVSLYNVKYTNNTKSYIDLSKLFYLSNYADDNIAKEFQANIGSNIDKINIEEFDWNILKDLSVEVDFSKGFDIFISQMSTDNIFTLQLGRCGINNLINIKSITYTPLAPEGDIFTLKSGTDWIGPYVVKDESCDVNNTENFPLAFTGGWHGRKIDSEEVNTAYLGEYHLFIDNQEILNLNEVQDSTNYSPTASYNCKEITLQTTNYINGYNTDYPILKETITYNIKGRKINIRVDGEALRDISINKYYGIQSQNLLWQGSVSYIYSDGTQEQFSTLSNSIAKSKKDCTLSNIILKSPDENLQLIMKLNTSSGLGKLTYLKDNEPLCFTESYGKTYFNLINGASLKLNKNEQYYWEGYYQFLDK